MVSWPMSKGLGDSWHARPSRCHATSRCGNVIAGQGSAQSERVVVHVGGQTQGAAKFLGDAAKKPPEPFGEPQGAPVLYEGIATEFCAPVIAGHKANLPLIDVR